MVLSLMNERPSSVRAEAAYVVESDIADTASIHMDFSNRVKAKVSVSWIHPYKEQKLIVVADNAMVVFDDAQPWNKKLALFNHKVDFSGGSSQIVRSDVEYISVHEAEPLREECKYFYELIAGDVPPLTDGQEGLRVLNVLEAASLSLSAN
jgi:UDP-2-acetamido-3-amino-2,3-dideoxy-glucuronate N-acetyltransferase